MMSTSCLPRSIAHAQKIGQELLLLAKRARDDGKLTELEWQKLPSTPEGMMKLITKGGMSAHTLDMLIRVYSNH